MLARGAGTTTVCWREIFTLMSVGMITRSAVAVPAMARSALFSPASGGGEIWLSCRSRQRKVIIVGNALEAHSAKWVAKQANKEGSMKFSSDVGPDGQSVVVAGGVVALGKFDALHLGHRALAERASELGTPFLLSFSGMAEVLGWEARLPVVARCDRTRVMRLWAKHCGDVPPQEYALDFAKVRLLSPEHFVEKMAKELKVKGVVAGANYRFGYKAAGDASDLVRLCQEYGLQAAIVDPVMDGLRMTSPVVIDDSSREKGQVSTTRVRKALAKGNMKRVAELLGRKHRLIIRLDNSIRNGNIIKLSVANVLNQPPKLGIYDCRLVVEENADDWCPDRMEGRVRIESNVIVLELQDSSHMDSVTRRSRVAFDFLY